MRAKGLPERTENLLGPSEIRVNSPQEPRAGRLIVEPVMHDTDQLGLLCFIVPSSLDDRPRRQPKFIVISGVGVERFAAFTAPLAIKFVAAPHSDHAAWPETEATTYLKDLCDGQHSFAQSVEAHGRCPCHELFGSDAGIQSITEALHELNEQLPATAEQLAVFMVSPTGDDPSINLAVLLAHLSPMFPGATCIGYFSRLHPALSLFKPSS